MLLLFGIFQLACWLVTDFSQDGFLLLFFSLFSLNAGLIFFISFLVIALLSSLSLKLLS
jgi:hypothetical protein